MYLVFKLFTIVLIATASAQSSKSKNSKKYDPDNTPIQPSLSLLTLLQGSDTANIPPSLPVNLELPRQEAPTIPFYTPEPGTITILKAPVPYYQNPSTEYNPDYPVPSQELQVPAAEPWNPNDDPKFYYEIPRVVSKQEIPTNVYPKKYNKDVYEKQKPLSSRPKQEINLIPISELDYAKKRKNINKVLLNLAKVENQKLVESEKVQTMKYDVTENTASRRDDTEKEPQTAASGFSHGFGAEGINQAISANNGFNHDAGSHAELSSSPLESGGLHTASADLHHAHSSAPKNRLEFQVHGHDGPSSYKWGFDTGKGHNRQFRYEERDKHGYVKGHYGYHDKHGKLRMVHYDAHPHEGFHAEDSD